MRLASYLLLCLLGLAALVLTVAEPASATVQVPAPIGEGNAPPGSGMTCCHAG